VAFFGQKNEKNVGCECLILLSSDVQGILSVPSVLSGCSDFGIGAEKRLFLTFPVKKGNFQKGRGK
jgi:hypothetical protein